MASDGRAGHHRSPRCSSARSQYEKDQGPRGRTQRCPHLHLSHQRWLHDFWGGGTISLGPKKLTDPIPKDISERYKDSNIFLGTATFVLEYQYNGKKVTDYIQQTGDPAILQAAAFESGIMVDSLWDWLFINGYGPDNPIFQPDFFLVGGGDLYFAVDLAALGAAGKAFVDLWDLGSVFSINALGGLDAMPFYQFSTTPLRLHRRRRLGRRNPTPPRNRGSLRRLSSDQC